MRGMWWWRCLRMLPAVGLDGGRENDNLGMELMGVAIPGSARQELQVARMLHCPSTLNKQRMMMLASSSSSTLGCKKKQRGDAYFTEVRGLSLTHSHSGPLPRCNEHHKKDVNLIVINVYICPQTLTTLIMDFGHCHQPPASEFLTLKSLMIIYD